MAFERILKSADCRSGIRWGASLDLPLVRIWASVHGVCQQIADAIRVRCNQLSVLCGRLATTGLSDPSEHATCFAALSACTWIDGHSAGLERECFCGRRPSPIRDGVVKASRRGARRGVARSVPLLAQPLRAPRSLRHTAEVSGEVQRFRDLGWTLAVPPTHEVQECIQQWCKKRLTFWNARSQTEGDDLGIRLLGLLEGLVNETLEVIDGL